MSILGLGLLGTLLATGAGVGVYWLTARWFKSRPIGPAIFTATTSAIIASMFNPWVTDRLNRKRDDENRRWTVRQTHLNSLRPVLRTEADQLQGIVTQLASSGFYASPDGAPWGQEYRALWQEGNPLADDLVTQFKPYDAERQFLKEALRNQDRVYQKLRNELFDLVVSGKVGPTDRGLQMLVRDELLKQCRGIPASFSIENIQADTFDYRVSAGAWQVRLSYLPEFKVALNFFKSYSPPPEVQAACETLRAGAPRLIEKAKDLSLEARKLAEGAALPGDCPYLRVD